MAMDLFDSKRLLKWNGSSKLPGTEKCLCVYLLSGASFGD